MDQAGAAGSIEVEADARSPRCTAGDTTVRLRRGPGVFCDIEGDGKGVLVNS